MIEIQHEGRESYRDCLSALYSSEDGVHHSHGSLLSGNKTTNMSKKDNQAILNKGGGRREGREGERRKGGEAIPNMKCGHIFNQDIIHWSLNCSHHCSLYTMPPLQKGPVGFHISGPEPLFGDSTVYSHNTVNILAGPA